MNETTRMQLDIIMKKFRKMKSEKMALSEDNKELKVVCRNLRERHCKSEKHRHTLIKICSESTERNKAKIQSLERENKNLRDIVDEQNQQLEEHLKTITKQNKELEVLRKEKDRKSCLNAELERLMKEREAHEKLKEEFAALKKEKEEQRRICLLNHINKPKCSDTRPKLNMLRNERISITNTQNFCHPSFEVPTKSKSKKKGRSLSSQLRWANLDIQVNGHVINRQNSDPNSQSKDKKRKLYCSNDDVTVDLTSEE